MSGALGPVRVFIATSLDGFIAGPGDDLSWLPEGGGEDHGYDDFMAEIGAVLMGRTTYDVVLGMPSPWPFGDTPVFIATSRPLEPVVPTVRAVAGQPEQMLAAVRDVVADGGIYADGGVLIRQFLAAGLIDDLTVTIVPVILGAGTPLFAGLPERHRLTLTGSQAYGSGLVTLKYLPALSAPGARTRA
jgi:dihydrofolate reductase